MSNINNYGRFIEEEQCFELTSEPPRKWLNMHYNKIGDNEIFSQMSNIGDGFMQSRDRDGNTCIVVSYDSKYLYIRDEETGKVFCPGGSPAPTDVEDFSCRYYAHKTEIKGTYDGLTATQRMFVPQNELAEVWTLTLENNTDKPKKVSVFGYVKFSLSGWGDNVHVSNVNYSEIHEEIGGVLVCNHNKLAPTNMYKGYIIALNNYKGADGYRDQFLRSDFSVGTPRIMWGYDCQNKPWRGPDSAGAVQTYFEIPANSSVRVDYVIGQTGSLEDVKEVKKRFTQSAIEEMVEEQRLAEQKRIDAFKVNTGNANLDALFNFFVKKQLYFYLINKSGFRDNLQNDCAYSMVEYEVAEQNLLRALTSQFPDGKVNHSFRPLNRLQYSDKPAWIPMTVTALIKESGDFSLLDKVVPYFECDESGTVMDHMMRAVRFLINDTGKHGLCRQHHADWNDGLESTPETGERESIMVTQQLCHGLLEIAELAKQLKNAELEKEVMDAYEMFKERLNNVAWDGEWYVRFICEDGYKAGSSANEEGKIFTNAQAWAVLSKIASNERANLSMDNLEKYLGCDLGYMIVAPGFSKYDPRIGGMSNSLPGSAENGGVYNHASGFKAVADCMLGRAENAWETLIKIAPDNPKNPVSVSCNEPFSFTNSVSTTEYDYGYSGYPWATGTAAWFAMVLVEWILGARRSYDGLLIDPCLSKKVPKASIIRTFRGAKYDIRIDNTSGNCKGVKSITVDGEKIEGNVLPVFKDGTHIVEVVL